MIKIEFKEAQRHILDGNGIISTYSKDMYFEYPNIKTRLIRKWFDDSINSVSFGCASELVPSRSEVLNQLGISKEQDDSMQLKHSIEHFKATDL